MSDTPRTDDAEYLSYDSEPPESLEMVDVAFARQLERELNAANSKIELLMSANADVARIADERDAAEKRVRLLIAERDTARGYADQKWKLRQEFHDLFGTDDISEAVALVRELQARIKRLEEDLMDAKNQYAVLVADVALYEDSGERIKRLEDIISRASSRFFRDGSNGQVANGMLTILEEVRLK